MRASQCEGQCEGQCECRHECRYKCQYELQHGSKKCRLYESAWVSVSARASCRFKCQNECQGVRSVGASKHSECRCQQVMQIRLSVASTSV